MWLFPEVPSFHATEILLPRTAGDGNSIVPAYFPGPRGSSPSASAGNTFEIFTPRENEVPPMVDLKNHSEKVVGCVPVQLGSLTAIFSANTYNVPVEVTSGVAPMYCANEQPTFVALKSNLSAYFSVHVLPPLVECATGRPLKLALV